MESVLTFEEYRSLVSNSGPFIRGIDSRDVYDRACEDKRTAFAYLADMKKVPCVIPTDLIEYINREYFKGVIGYSASLDCEGNSFPVEVDVEKIKAFGSVVVVQEITHEGRELHSRDAAFLQQLGGKVIRLYQSADGKESRVSCFSAFITPNTPATTETTWLDSIQLLPNSQSVQVFIGGIDRQIFDDVWNMYEPAFKKLTSEHPFVGDQKYEELLGMVNLPNSCTLISFEDDEPSGFITICSIDNIPWLDQNYFKAKYSDEYAQQRIVYSPALVCKQSRGGYNAIILANALGNILGSIPQGVLFVGECPNRSEPYVKYLVKRFGYSSKVKALDFKFESQCIIRKIDY